MDETRVATLKVPGASLHYEVRGDGPLLLIIPGMPADAGLYTVLARRLAAGWTVVTYDPRGMSRSRLDGPATDQLVEVHADDAQRVLAAVGAGPAHVLTDSVSGLVGLQVAATEPEKVRTLVAFEPPVTELLPDRERWRAFSTTCTTPTGPRASTRPCTRSPRAPASAAASLPTPTRTPRPRPRWPASTRTWTGGWAPDIPRL
ncbi:MAG TPA: alpha/beta fold hydrolase, partial [Actinomycetota bacterium]|nr:alpha/beta fold hydrolase [Actinomycetota bacterium]